MQSAHIESIDEIILRCFAFLTESGFVLKPRPLLNDILRAGYQFIRYDSEQWAIEIYLEYREGYYEVNLIPLEHGEPRQVPFGHRIKWGLELYLTQILGIQDEMIGRVHELYEATLVQEISANTSVSSQLKRKRDPQMVLWIATLTKRMSIEFASQVFAIYSALLARHLDEIVASHPPIG